MGHGIVQSVASSKADYAVVGLENNSDALIGGKKSVEDSIDRLYSKLVSKQKITESEAESEKRKILGKISFTDEKSALYDCDLIVEAITENPKVKLPLYEDLGRNTKETCILASNTSSLKIEDMAEASGVPSRVIGLHFFNPVQVMRLVEVVKTKSTEEKIFERAKSFVLSLDKHPVSCLDTPGFIVNRLLVPSLAQAMMMFDRKEATIADIDKSMELGAGHPMGPLALADYVGLDTCLFILKGWVEEYPKEPAFVVPKCLEEMVESGRLGRKSGRGFYEWKGDKKIGPSIV